MHLWKIREISGASSGAPAIQEMVHDACLEHLYKLVSEGVIDLDIAAQSAEIEEKQFVRWMQKKGYKPQAPLQIQVDDDHIDMLAAIEDKKRKACRRTVYELVGYMIYRDMQQKEMTDE